jgi:biopolymer transport protein ExbD
MAMKNIYPATSEEQSEINLTPMLDVVFIMLILFVVTASFVKEFDLDITLPAGSEVIPQEVETIKVVIEYDDSFHVNGRVLAKGELQPNE